MADLTDRLSDWLADSMEQSLSSETKSHSARLKITRLLLNSKDYYNVHRSPPLIPTLNQMNPVYNFRPRLPKIHSNIIFPSTARSSE